MDVFVSGLRRQKVKKYNDKYAHILAIHVDNHFNDKFVSLCHVGYFTNDDRQIYLSHFLHFQRLNFVFTSFRNIFISESHIDG